MWKRWVARWIGISTLPLQVLGFLGYGTLAWECGHFSSFWSTLLDLIEHLQFIYYSHLVDKKTEIK